jgi:predicted MFS family arabinose efflux permease
LFYADGITCISAGLLFFFYFRSRKGNVPTKAVGITDKDEITPYKDLPYLFFVLLSSCFAILFFQFIFTLPLFYRQVYLMPEAQIGGLLALNGFIVFLLEMIVVYKIGNKIAPWKLIFLGMILLGISFTLLNIGHGILYLVVAMTILSISEILVMPYLATVSVQRAGLRNRGAYMGLYTLSYSVGFVLAPFLGTTIIDHYGFETLWWLVGVFAIFTAFGFYLTLRWMGKMRTRLVD